MKRKIYLNEYNIPTNNSIFLPYSSGLLQTYAQQTDLINEHYEFVKIFFQRDTVDNIVQQYDNPDVVGFSVSMWNYQLSLAVAESLKKKFPDCIVIFGGPHVTQDEQNGDDKFFNQFPFIDFAVYREGEIAFAKILQQRIDYALYHDETLESWHEVLYDKVPPKDLDIFPSPYTNGVFDDIIKSHPELEFKAIIETNRNCPFNCAFCYYGNNDINTKIRYHGLNYLQKEFEWIARNKIKYTFCADANFGMYKRDIDVAQIYVNVKKQYGYPEKFRVCYGKNATDNIFNTAQILSKSNLNKTVTLSVQSFDHKVLDSINRKNIKVDAFKKLQKQYNEAGIPTYTEIILGLPNETKESFLNGLETAIRLVKDNQMFIYHCQILPNTKLADPEYKKQYGIGTVKIPLAEVHVTARQDDFVQEWDEIIVQTNTMTHEEWIECAVISWIVQLFHSLGVGNKIVDWLVDIYGIDYMDFYKHLAHSYFIDEIDNLWYVAQNIQCGQPRCQLDKRFGNTYYEMEELTYLNIVCDKDRFYDELYKETINFLLSNKHDFVVYKPNSMTMGYQFTMQKALLPNSRDFDSLEEFATQTIIYGRKNNKIIPISTL